jgi:hypothetical protein
LNQQTQRWPPEQFGVYFLLNFKLLKRMKNEMSLDGYEVKELEVNEKLKLDGGGWLADGIAFVITTLKCNCKSPSGTYHAAMSSSNYGGIR